jgi:sodium/bile acid cotransporter 7
MKTTGETQPILPVIVDLLQWLVLPLALGQGLRPWFGAWAMRHKKRVGLIDRLAILVLVYTSFCDSFKQGVWSGNGPWQLLGISAVCAVLFALVMLVTGAVARGLGFNREDRIVAMFCGSKKTLASGVPMAKLIFGAHPGLGLILLPIMVYHPLQLIVCGVLAQRWGKQG